MFVVGQCSGVRGGAEPGKLATSCRCAGARSAVDPRSTGDVRDGEAVALRAERSSRLIRRMSLRLRRVFMRVRLASAQVPAPRRNPSRRHPSGPSTLTVDCQFGLGNRLRALASAAEIARNTGRQLRIVWELDRHCGCELSDLLDLEAMGLTVVARRAALAEAPLRYINNTGRAVHRRRSIPSTGSVYVASPYRLRSWFGDPSSADWWLRSLVPAPQVRMMIDAMDHSHGIGIHLRVIPPSIEDFGSPSAFAPNARQLAAIEGVRRATRPAAFIETAQSVLRDGETVYFASDCETSAVLAEQAFGSRLRRQRGISRARDTSGMQAALVDACLLAQSRVLIGSRRSSFTGLAQAMAKPDRTLLIEGVHFA